MGKTFQGAPLTASDIRKVKEEMAKHAANTPTNALLKLMEGFLGHNKRSLTRLINIARSFSDEVVNLFEAGKINSSRLQKIAETEYPNAAYKDFLARKAVEEEISPKELDEIRDYLRKGRHPVEAIDIVRGRRPKQSITRNDALSLERIVREWEKDGFSWRQRAELIRAQGKIQVLQNGTLNGRIGYTLAAMKVAVDDMHRYVTAMWADIPKEEQEAIRAEFVHPSDHERKEEHEQEPVMERAADFKVVEALPQNPSPPAQDESLAELPSEKTPVDGEEATT